MRLLVDDLSLSQRDLGRALRVSVGRVKYRLKALLERGYVKPANFKSSRYRRGYLYQLSEVEANTNPAEWSVSDAG